MSKETVKQENPWDVSNIQEFLYYNCPECDTKVKDSEVFLQHALDNHELSKFYLNKEMLEIVSNDQDDIISDHEMEDSKDRKPTLDELNSIDNKNSYLNKTVKIVPQNHDEVISDQETKETKPTQGEFKTDTTKFMRLRLHKIKVESSVPLKGPDSKVRKVDYDQDMDYEPGFDSYSDIDIPAEDDDDVKPDESFFCDMCDKFFNSASGLNQHITVQHIPKADRLNEQCDMCGLKCTEYQALKKHQVANHFEVVQCDTCDYKCHSKRMLKVHMQKHRKIECPQCDAAFTRAGPMALHAKEKHFNSVSCHKCDYKCHSKVMLEEHGRKFHKLKYRYDGDNEGTFTCRVCHFKTQNEEEMKDHQWEHQDIEWAYKCELCEATFSRRSAYGQHKDVVHMGILPYKCEQCDLSFKNRAYLRSHTKKVHETIPSNDICTICGKSVIHLKQHMKTMHPEKEDGGTCDQCGMFFDKKYLLQNHIHRYHKRKFQVCTICEKFFIGTKKQQLIDHYTDEHAVFCNKNTMYVCDICKTKVTSAKELAEHYHTVHESKDDFHCTKCDHKEPTKALLSIHCLDAHNMNPFNDLDIGNETSFKEIKVLEDSKTYQCSICSKKLTSKVTLNNHIKQMHDKSNHVKCDHCPNTYALPSDLKKHILMKHTARTKFPCSQCSFVTNRKDHFKRHFRRVHENEYRFKCTVCEKPIEDPGKLQQHMLKAHDILYKL